MLTTKLEGYVAAGTFVNVKSAPARLWPLQCHTSNRTTLQKMLSRRRYATTKLISQEPFIQYEKAQMLDSALIMTSQCLMVGPDAKCLGDSPAQVIVQAIVPGGTSMRFPDRGAGSHEFDETEMC